MECNKHYLHDCEECQETEEKYQRSLKCRCSVLAYCRCGNRNWDYNSVGQKYET